MRKILTVILAICMLACMLCVPAFAAGTVLRVSAQKGSSTVVIGDYDNFQDGWNAAMEIAGSSGTMKENGYDRIIVDIYTDWNANTDGEFTEEIWNGKGFDNDTIYIPEDAKVTLNMNGHTINRGLTKDEDDGEVMFINDDADVIINNGTIQGGYSNSEGGGLYIEGGAKVTLNQVNLVNNAVENDDGAAIYMYGGSTLTMNGGSISDNVMEDAPCGAICVMDSTVVLKNVTINGNYAKTSSTRGLVIYADRSTVKMNQCTVSNNATKGSVAEDIIYAKDSALTITDTDLTKNNTPGDAEDVSPRLFYLQNSELTMTDGNITKNGGEELFYFYGSGADMTGVTITDNTAAVMDTKNAAEVIHMTECTLGNNKSKNNTATIKLKKQGELVMTDCVIGDTTFSNMKYVKTVTSSVPKKEAVIGISGILADGTVAFAEYYKNFAYGWSLAMEYALSEAYDRVVIDLYEDWTSDKNGRFADSMVSGKGFFDYTILVPEGARITLNMNGHTINRLLSKAKENGEVILIDREADVIINDGTISGGFSSNSAGGIHINGFATVTLNDVCIFDNESSKTGNGAGIALYDYASLTMNGGSLTENRVQTNGTIFADGGAWASLNHVTINDNRSGSRAAEGVAIAASNRGAVLLTDCVVSGNAVAGKKSAAAESIVAGWNATFIFTNTDFINNSSDDMNQSADNTYLFNCYETGLNMKGGSITNNHPGDIFRFAESGGHIEGVTITDNAARPLTIYNRDKKVTLTGCTLNNNKSARHQTNIEVATEGTLVLVDCDLGDTVYGNKDMADLPNPGVASIFGEGSLTMIVVLLSLVTSVASMCMTVAYNKKKTVSASANHAAETEDEE